MLKSVWHLLETTKKWLSIEVLQICSHENSTGLLWKRKKKKSEHQKQNTIPILFLYLTRINLLLLFWVLFFSCLMCFYGSKLSLSAIYKNVNSKLYLLRMSSFLIYIYTIVHLIYFFYTVLNTQTYFAVHGIFILFSWICFPILFSLVSITGWISQKN